MKNAINRVLAMTIAFALSFTIIPAVSGGLDVHAASKPAKVTKLRLAATGQTTARVSWNKIKKGLNGYTVFRNGRAIRHLGKNVTSLSDAGLNPGTTYSYYVRAYKNTKQKQWFNKKTNKWQKKKPARKFRGKSRKVKVKVYGKASPTLRCKTAAAPKPQATSFSCGISKKPKKDRIVFSVTSIEGSDTHVKIFKGNVLLATLNGSNRVFEDTGLESGKTYSYIIETWAGGVVQERSTYNGTAGGTKLRWGKINDIERIEIYRDSYLVDTISGSETSYEYDNESDEPYSAHVLKFYKAGESEPSDVLKLERRTP